jgi:putative nucleotidyltransferase with HDIG domain
MRYLPHAVVATTAVAIMPIAVVWWLGSDGVITSSWLCLALALALALGAALVGDAYWKRRRGGADLMFSELLLWGWLRRLRVERRLANGNALLGSLRRGELRDAGDVEQRARALAQLAVAVELQDAYTIGHSRRVARHAAVIARALGLPDEQAKRIQAAATVHDIGKLHVPRAVLNKPDRLTDAEFELAKRHAKLGAEMVSCLGDAELTAIVRHHHERIDGTGYPDGLAADEIPIGARIVAVADTFDAIVSTRPYRPAAPHKRAIDVLRKEAGTHLDANVVHAFLSRYAGRRSLSVWAALALVPGVWVRALRGTRRPGSPGQQVATGAALAAFLAAALAAPLASTRQPARLHAPAPPVVAAAVQPPTPPAISRPVSRHVARRQHVSTARAATSTCQAYNPQLCSSLSAGGSAGGAAGGSSGPSANSPGGTLPFTGLDLGLIALLGGTLIAFGVIVRSVSRSRREA